MRGYKLKKKNVSWGSCWLVVLKVVNFNWDNVLFLLKKNRDRMQEWNSRFFVSFLSYYWNSLLKEFSYVNNWYNFIKVLLLLFLLLFLEKFIFENFIFYGRNPKIIEISFLRKFYYFQKKIILRKIWWFIEIELF